MYCWVTGVWHCGAFLLLALAIDKVKAWRLGVLAASLALVITGAFNFMTRMTGAPAGWHAFIGIELAAGAACDSDVRDDRPWDRRGGEGSAVAQGRAGLVRAGGGDRALLQQLREIAP